MDLFSLPVAVVGSNSICLFVLASTICSCVEAFVTDGMFSLTCNFFAVFKFYTLTVEI